MSHNQRLRQDSFYVRGVPVPQDYVRALDTAQSKALFADAAPGAGYSAPIWAPSSPIQIGGAGVWLCGPSAFGVGPTVTTPLGSGKRIVLDDVPQVVDGHEYYNQRAISTPCRNAFGAVKQTPPQQNSAPFPFPNGVLVSPAVAFRFVMPIRVHHGSVLMQAVLTMDVVGGHFAIPSSLPQMRIYAVDALGDVIPMSGIPNSDGWRSIPTPASPAAYNGSTQTITYAIGPGGLGLPIDRVNFIYMAEIVDELGVGALPGNAYESVSCIFHGIQDLRPQ